MTFLLVIAVLSPAPEAPCERANAIELARGVRVIAAHEPDDAPRAACVAPFSFERLEPDPEGAPP